MTAKEILSLSDTDPIAAAFRNLLNGKQATRRKASEFLRDFGASYGIRNERIPVAVPVAEKRKTYQPMDLSGSTSAINRQLIRK
jgi:hypothetical protein